MKVDLDLRVLPTVRARVYDVAFLEERVAEQRVTVAAAEGRVHPLLDLAVPLLDLAHPDPL